MFSGKLSWTISPDAGSVAAATLVCIVVGTRDAGDVVGIVEEGCVVTCEKAIDKVHISAVATIQ